MADRCYKSHHTPVGCGLVASTADADLAQQEFLGALEAVGGAAGNVRLRELLGWSQPDYDTVKAALLAAGQIKAGRAIAHQ